MASHAGFNFSYFRFLVDGTPIREYKNLEKDGICFPKNQAMKLYSSIWNADDWATRGGLVKTNWSKGPFTAYYKNYGADNACVSKGKYSSCRTNSKYLPFNNNPWLWEKLDSQTRGKMVWMRNKYMVYDYCKDTKRFPKAPKECYLNNNPNYWYIPHCCRWWFFQVDQFFVIVFHYTITTLSLIIYMFFFMGKYLLFCFLFFFFYHCIFVLETIKHIKCAHIILSSRLWIPSSSLWSLDSLFSFSIIFYILLINCFIF